MSVADEATKKLRNAAEEDVDTEDRSKSPFGSSFKPRHADGTVCNAVDPSKCPKNPENQVRKRMDQFKMNQNQTVNRAFEAFTDSESPTKRERVAQKATWTTPKPQPASYKEFKENMIAKGKPAW